MFGQECGDGGVGLDFENRILGTGVGGWDGGWGYALGRGTGDGGMGGRGDIFLKKKITYSL